MTLPSWRLYAWVLAQFLSYGYPEHQEVALHSVCICVVKVCVCMQCACVCIHMHVKTTRLFSLCHFFESLHLPVSPFPSTSFFPVDSISSLCCLSNKTVSSIALEWVSLIISFRWLLCLKTWGQGRQEERNVNLQGVPVVWWVYCWRGA